MVPGYSARGALRDAVAKGFADRLKSPIARGHLFAELLPEQYGPLKSLSLPPPTADVLTTADFEEDGDMHGWKDLSES